MTTELLTTSIDKPVPLADAVTQPFWDAAARHELIQQRCADCRRYSYPPTLTCSNCQSDDLPFEPVSGRGVVHSFAIMRLPLHAGFVDEVPFAICMIQLEESEDLLMVSNVVGTPIDEITVGMPVVVDFDDRPQATVPVFRAA